MIDRTVYRNPIALDRNEHRQLRLTRPIGELAASAAANALFVTAVEFVDVCREYPVVFVRAGDEPGSGKSNIAPMAVLGLALGENLYLDAQAWRATYVPASLRRYPFAMARMADPTQLAVMIDREWGGWSEVDGQPLFDVDGQPQPVLEQARKFLEQFETEAERTRLFCARLRDEDLLQDMRFDATLPDGKKLTVEGFLTIDEVKVAGLPDAKVVELHRNGMLGLIHMQQASLPLMRRLLEWRLACTAT